MSYCGFNRRAGAQGFLLVVAMGLGVGCERRSVQIMQPTSVFVPEDASTVTIKLDARLSQSEAGSGSGFDGAFGCTGAPEMCNGIDDDCDGLVDNGFDLLTDPLNCGACGFACSAPTATTECRGGLCGIAECTPGYVDADGDSGTGCECMLTNGGREICDGADNDCDGVIDDGYDLQHDPSNCGACGVVCNAANGDSFCAGGACGFTCRPGYHDIDKQPSDGCEYACATTADAAEICDGLDNDCNGLFDGEDTGMVYVPADRACYSSASGACQSGLQTCIAGRMTCVGAGPPSEEICDGRDNNCDGRVDESDPNLGKTCYSPGTAGCNLGTGVCQGACKLGAYACAAGSLVCAGQATPVLETCDGLDNDCDGVIDNGIDMDTDPRNCGGCGHGCNFPHAFAACVAGVCVLDEKNRLGACAPGWVDQNDNPADGCEYPCTPDGPELCDGVDNDCNGLVDNDDPGLLYPSNFCLQIGECGKGPGGSKHQGWESFATFPLCGVPLRSPAGTPATWWCNYPATVELDAGNQVVVKESWCDGFDNDCNGVVDDPYRSLLGTACADPTATSVGACQRKGTWRCQSSSLALSCDLSGASAALPADESCDGVDNDCDGLVDEPWDNPAGLASCGDHDCLGVRDDLVHINAVGAPGNYYLYKFEASRVDADALSQGSGVSRACSRAQDRTGGKVLPWSGVTWNQADVACRAAGMRLCKIVRAGGAVVSDEWGFACQAGLACLNGAYPYNTTCAYNSAACNGLDSNLSKAASCGAFPSCATVADLDTGRSDDQVYDMSGNLAEWTDDRRDILDTMGSPAGAGTASSIYTTRGGAYDSFFRGMACDFTGTQIHPTYSYADTGFRCCSSCPPGQADCAGVCANLASDSAHCGGCAVACGTGTTCQNGICK